MTLDDWLSLNGNQNLRRVSELMTVNRGRLDVEGDIGTIVQADNKYGRLGLEIHEAFELTYYKGVIDALTNSSPDPMATARAAMVRINREASGRLIEIASPEQQRELLQCQT